jgi:hypothetical protein
MKRHFLKKQLYLDKIYSLTGDGAACSDGAQLMMMVGAQRFDSR